MKLKKYRQKRNFQKTLEPRGNTVKRKSKKFLYVIQKHAASHLHYDLRLEIDGVLKSWAVPKGPSLNPAVKRLAVHVEDHPIEYGGFEGTIPQGQYGGGIVMLWDKGTWENDVNNKQGYKKGDLTFTLHGDKLNGKWKLIRIKKDPKNWLLIKIDDEYARSGKYDVTKEMILSALSGKTLEEINENPTFSDIPSKKDKVMKLLAKLPVKQVKIPSSIDVQLATLVDKPPEDERWLHEIKYDGYRFMCHINKDIKLLTRNQKNWSKKFPEVLKDINKLGLKNTVMDGEIVGIGNEDTQITYYVFDILYYNNYDLTHLPLLTRKKILQAILGESKSSVQYCDHILGQGPKVYKNACRLSLEGVVSKAINSIYEHKRTKTWLKTKCLNQQEFIICGYTDPNGSRSYFGSLLLGYYKKNKQLKYAGCVGTGFDESKLKIIYNILKKYRAAKSYFNEVPKLPKKVTWVKPKIIAEVKFLEWTKNGIIRHSIFKRLRPDKDPSKTAVKKETKKSIVKEIKPEVFLESSSLPSFHFALSHPEKILYPDKVITKLHLATYYEQISEWILPYIVKRPLTLLRCPQGVDQKCFYQRHLDNKNEFGHELFPINITNKTSQDYIYLKDLSGLIKLVQMGVLEIHPWGCMVDKVNRPDMIIFDLDPGNDVPWKEVIKSAFVLKEELENYNLLSFVKTTGKKGLHVVVPIQRRYEWDVTLAFSKAFVDYLVIKYPESFVGQSAKVKRHGKIFIDYIRNNKSATAIAPFSTRATEKASIALPLAWEELSIKIKADQFNINNVHTRLKINPWKDFYQIKQSLPRIK